MLPQTVPTRIEKACDGITSGQQRRRQPVRTVSMTKLTIEAGRKYRTDNHCDEHNESQESASGDGIAKVVRRVSFRTNGGGPLMIDSPVPVESKWETIFR